MIEGRLHGMKFIERATALMHERKSEEALQIIHDQLKKGTDEEKFAVAEFLKEWGFYDDALEILQELQKKFPEEIEVKILLASIYIDMYEDEEALMILEDIPEDDPAYEQALLLLADVYQAQGLIEVAEQKLLTAKRRNPKELIFDLALGEFYFSIGEFQKAIVYYERVYDEETKINGLSISARIAETLSHLGKHEEALQYFQKISDHTVDQLFQYGLAAFYAKRNEIADKCFREVIEKDPFHYAAYLSLAEVYEADGNVTQAYETIREGINVNEFDVNLYYEGGRLAYKLNQFEESEQLLQQAVSLDSEFQDAVLLLIQLYKEQEKYDDIVGLIQALQTDHIYNPQYEWELAHAYEALEQYELASQYYEKAYEELEDHADFLKEYGYFLLEEGKHEKAIELFEKYLKIEPMDNDLSNFVDQLKMDRLD